ncbi:SKI family transcriptional corepressor 1 homolog-B [Aplysia californica]|uniref:SKI family transcriptional corepressor 1 homolog-B n=1 Tax=Aplysia californica TaxID=6500 RepID=A0ABM0JM71_APLCA|nr:SKI family transcriptional corepressor 1 homolog-B [Aplysia californica]
MEPPSMENCLPGAMGMPCRSPHSQWASPPVAHAHHPPHSTAVMNTSPFMGYTPSSPDHDSKNNAYMNDGNNGSNSNNNNNNNNLGVTMTPAGTVGTTSNSNSNNNNNNNNNNNSSTNNNNNERKSSGERSVDSSGPRQNQVGTILLHGEAIVSLVIDNKERLCLAQISNTLLKDYSYNEIHNRRVALGITCVQCTPVQLEILRRAGAMPVSSRRCGMITKREAERLVKSFLEENSPPKLPEDFAFDVHHECGWGCRGLFEPSRYNSSRAKCIKCSYCNMYFSPNKFIFHFHRTPEAKYNHPDAANFNSWRRHLKLYSGHDIEEIAYKWEDVKAMFNGGTRKRLFTSTSSSSSSSTSSSSSAPSMSSSVSNLSSSLASRSSQLVDGCSGGKKSKPSSTVLDTSAYLPKPPPFPNPFNPYNWLATAPGKSPYPFMAMNSTQSMCFGFPQQPANKDAVAERMKASALAPHAWMGRSASAAGPFPLSSMDLLWEKAFPFQQAALGYRGAGYPTPPLAGATNHPVVGGALMDPHLPSQNEDRHCISPGHNIPQNLIKSSMEGGHKGRGDRMSAFKRVGPISSSSPPSSSSLSPPLSGQEDNENHFEDDDDRRGDEDDNENDNMCAQDLSTHSHKDNEDTEEIDVEENHEDKNRTDDEQEPIVTDDLADRAEKKEDAISHEQMENLSKEEKLPCDHPDENHATDNNSHNCDMMQEESVNRRPDSALSPEGSRHQNDQEPDHTVGQDSGMSDESDGEVENQRTFGDMSKEELCQTLKNEVESRRRREKEVTVLKDTFKEEVNREKNFREHMAQQLEMLRETLTNELEQERKIRFSLQQKLKEAHDALQNFSCSLLTARREGYPIKDAGVVPR